VVPGTSVDTRGPMFHTPSSCAVPGTRVDS
jgi:hypothetical protein